MKEILEAMKATNALFTEEVIAKGNVGALERIYTADARVLPDGFEHERPIEIAHARPVESLLMSGLLVRHANMIRCS